MWTSSVTMNDSRKQRRNSEIDLSELVAKATATSPLKKQFHGKMDPITPSPTITTISLSQRKSYQKKSKTSAEIISETKNMLAQGEKEKYIPLFELRTIDCATKYAPFSYFFFALGQIIAQTNENK